MTDKTREAWETELLAHEPTGKPQITALLKPTGNGIACPRCEGELVDSSPGVTLMCNPPKKDVHCPACHYHGLRLS